MVESIHIITGLEIAANNVGVFSCYDDIQVPLQDYPYIKPIFLYTISTHTHTHNPQILFLRFLFQRLLFNLNLLFLLNLLLPKRLPQLTLAHAFPAGPTFLTPLPMRHHQHMQSILLLRRNPNFEMLLRRLPPGLLRPPPQQPHDPPDMRINGETFPSQAEEQHTARRLWPYALKRQQLFIRLFCLRIVEVVQGILAVFLMHLAENTGYDLALHNAQPTTFDRFLQLGFPPFHYPCPVVAAAIHFIHAQLRTRRVGVARVLGQDGADEGVEDGGAVTAPGGSLGRDDFFGPRAWAMYAGQDGVREARFGGSWVWESGKGGGVGV
jgi:hypothetical protein